MHNPSGLDPTSTRRAMRLSLWEGAVWAAMVGLGETFFVADAARLGASTLQLGLVIALPLAVGALGPMLSLALLARMRHRRPIAVFGAVIQAVALVGLALLSLTGRANPRWLIAIACLYQVAGQTAGGVWASWFGDIVPAARRGRYFGRRTAFVHLSTCAGLLLGGLVLQTLEHATPGEVVAGVGGGGFAVVYGLAAVFRLTSSLLLGRSPEPRFRGMPDRAAATRFLGSGRGRLAIRLVGLGGFLHLMVYVAAPYFPAFMLQELRFSYAEYTFATLAVIVFKSAFMHPWGSAIDRRGARPTFGVALFLAALVPLPWVWANGLSAVLVAQIFSAFAWSGHEVSSFTLMLDSTTLRTRPHAFALQSLVHGTAQLTGTALGALALPWLDGDFRVLFAWSSALRLAPAILAVLWLPSSARRRRGPLSLRVVGLRPHGGVAHRPVMSGHGDGDGEEEGVNAGEST